MVWLGVQKRIRTVSHILDGDPQVNDYDFKFDFGFFTLNIDGGIQGSILVNILRRFSEYDAVVKARGKNRIRITFFDRYYEG